MRRYLFLLPLVLLLLLAACGNDDGENPGPDDDSGNGNGEATAVNGNGSDDGNDDGDVSTEPGNTPRGFSTPTPVLDDGVVLVVAANGGLYGPTRQEFMALPQQTITVNGTQYTGVSLATLAEQAGAAGLTYVTIEGRSPDGQRPAIARFAIAEVASDSVLIVSDSGHVTLAGVDIPDGQWLTAIGAIDFS